MKCLGIAFKISAPAAQAFSALRRRGYRGLALLADPVTGHLVLLRSESWGCQCVDVRSIPRAGIPHELVELPDLALSLKSTSAIGEESLVQFSRAVN